MSMFSLRRKSALERQIDDLRDEISSLAHSLSRQGRSAMRQTQREASDYYGDLQDAVASALPALRRQSRVVERTVRDNPVPVAAAVGVAVLAIAAVAWLGRR